MKKVILVVIAVLIVTGAFGTLALAEGAGLLEIDNDHVYAGMTCSFSDGYSPAQSGDSVTIILPLVLADESKTIAGNITVTPNLGDTSSSPFVFKNYQKAFSLKTHKTNVADKTAYLAEFTLSLSADRFEGRYPVVFDVDYTSAEGEKLNQQFTLYVIVDGKDPNPKPTDPPVEKPRSQPKLIVSSYSIMPEVVEAGKEFEVSVTIKNTSEKYYARNIKVNYAGDGVNVLTADNTNTQYIDVIKDGESCDLKFKMMSRLDSTPGINKVVLNVEYEDSKTTAYSMSDEILFQITQPVVLEIDEFEIPNKANAGDSLALNLNVFNKGRSKVYNVMCKIAAQGLLPEGSVFIGNMEPGSTGSAELYAFVGTLNMSADEDGNVNNDNSSDENYGYTNGAVTVTYEDEFGVEYSQVIEFDMVIEAPIIQARPVTNDAEEEDKVSQWWISVLIAGLIIAGMTTLIIVSRKRKAKAYMDDGLDD